MSPACIAGSSCQCVKETRCPWFCDFHTVYFVHRKPDYQSSIQCTSAPRCTEAAFAIFEHPNLAGYACQRAVPAMANILRTADIDNYLWTS